MTEELTIYTIGHSDHTTARFIDLLRQHEITLVVDVRSQPYSCWTPQFNRETLVRQLQDMDDMAYLFLGDSLGGRPAERRLYDQGQERPNYRRMEETPEYQAGIERLLQLAPTGRIVVMCSEGDHRHCHRHLLITQTLLEQKARVLHIQPDGSTVDGERIPRQLSLF